MVTAAGSPVPTGQIVLDLDRRVGRLPAVPADRISGGLRRRPKAAPGARGSRIDLYSNLGQQRQSHRSWRGVTPRNADEHIAARRRAGQVVLARTIRTRTNSPSSMKHAAVRPLLPSGRSRSRRCAPWQPVYYTAKFAERRSAGTNVRHGDRTAALAGARLRRTLMPGGPPDDSALPQRRSQQHINGGGRVVLDLVDGQQVMICSTPGIISAITPVHLSGPCRPGYAPSPKTANRCRHDSSRAGQTAVLSNR